MIPPDDAPAAIAVRPGDPDLYVAVTKLGSTWLSTDGLAWRAGGPLEWARGAPSKTVRDVAYSGGRFTAAANGIAWTSTDGLDWEPRAAYGLDIRALAPEIEPLGAAAIDGSGFNGVGSGAFLQFDGGITAIHRPTGQFTSIGMGEMEDVLPSDEGFVIVGARRVGGGTVANVMTFDGVLDWHWITSAGPSGPGIEDFVLAPGGFAALGHENTLWTATAADDWSAPRTLDFEADRLFAGPDGSLLILGEGIWGSPDGLEWTRLDDGSAPTGAWAYAGGVAIGCDVGVCRSFVMDPLPEIGG